MSVRIVTKPTIEPVTVADVKLHAHITYAVEDGLIGTMISTARELAEAYLRMSIMSQTIEVMFEKMPRFPVRIPYAPVTSISNIILYDLNNTPTTLNLSDFYFDLNAKPALVFKNYNYNFPAIQIRQNLPMLIRYVAGYTSQSDVPAAIKHAIYLYCTWAMENRAMEGSSGQLLVPLQTAAPVQFYHLLDSCPDKCGEFYDS